MVIFNEAKHTYTNPETNDIYISVSQLLKRYKEVFDTNFHANRVALREGKTKQEVIDGWQKISKDACDKGIKIHNIFENYIKTGKIEEQDQELVYEFESVFNFKDYKKVNSELILYNHDHKLAGTSDIIADVNKDSFDVLDFKTNKKFLFNNKYNKYLKSPLDHLQECQYNDYSLQLSLYAYLYSKMSGKKVRQISILYHDGNKFYRYPTPYLFWEVTILLKHYGQTLINASKSNTVAV